VKSMANEQQGQCYASILVRPMFRLVVLKWPVFGLLEKQKPRQKWKVRIHAKESSLCLPFDERAVNSHTSGKRCTVHFTERYVLLE
jgi:hypothetical protein